MSLVYCMSCHKLNCEEATTLHTGFVVVDPATGKIDASGKLANVGVHLGAKGAETRE